jgi:dTMP kinase
MEWVIEANSLSAGILRPDLNIYIDISPEISMSRISKGRNSTELYETLDNLINVRNKFFEAFDQLKSTEKVFITDGNRNPGAIAEDIRKELSRL